MNQLPASSDGELRVGDGERRAVDALLHQAVGDGQLTLLEYEQRAGSVWAARTRAELAAVTRDLPAAQVAAPDAGSRPASPAGRLKRAIAIMSTDEVSGPVAPGQSVQAYSLMGTAKVDLRSVALPPELHVRAVAVMGDVKIKVPEGTTVHLSGVGVMGSRSVRVTPPQSGAPVVYLHAVAVMGDVQVRSQGAPHPAVQMLKDAHRRGSVAISSVGDPAPDRSPDHRPRGHRRIGALALAAGLGVVAITAANAPDSAAVMGSQTLRAVAGQEVDAAALMGSVVVVVPDAAGARQSGFVLMGSTECNAACTTGADPVHVNVIGAMGSVQVLTETEYAAAQTQARQEDLLDEDDEDNDRQDR